jgi:pre-60S factor REI1
VTREWYEARKAQLLASSAAPVQRVWFDPLTRKKFYTENTYAAYTRRAQRRAAQRPVQEGGPAAAA